MVAKIISGKSLIGALNYNEKKVQQGKADLIHQNGYAKDIIHLNFNDKLLRLKDLSLRNERVKTNTLHISLNFATGENLSTDLIKEVADEYMERIGFGSQPYLVYSHSDAGHPHVHIVSTNIKSSGERISLHNLGKTKSELARKALEAKFGLTPANSRQKEQDLNILSLSKIEYGKTDTKRALANTVNAVIKIYRFTSLPELNVVLQNFNVLADRGSKDSRMYTKNWLIYWAMDGKGNKVGVPIKASSLPGRPTLKFLEEKFKQNEQLRKPFVQNVRALLDGVLKTKASPAGFAQALHSKGIQVVFRRNESNYIYGITYIDHNNKVVFNGSDIGKDYSATALNKYFGDASHKLSLVDRSLLEKTSPASQSNNPLFADQSITNHELGTSLLDDLLKPDYSEGGGISNLFRHRRKKKRKGLSK
ncbi:relaxase/mobilization nuclease domain-containing protein [Pedobacter sp. SYSU D00535]|uniref:relaxase/mobilization nuclease domain-containing protein n=1 Tax=Pedobacter sp. SYSU D00535 TaxID=2810308 RepID=UPI001A9742D8|nr:relaxase/mobilization nuclease domain-containing protein [Pedobacter sp. SYSU D00535]